MIRWLIDFRFAAHYRLNSDIARGPKSARNRHQVNVAQMLVAPGVAAMMFCVRVVFMGVFFLDFDGLFPFKTRRFAG